MILKKLNFIRMEKIKDFLLDVYLLPTAPVSIFFCIIFIYFEIKDNGLDYFLANGIDQEKLLEIRDNHFPILFQRILSLVLWILIIIHYI